MKLNFFFTANLSVYSERLSFRDKRSLSTVPAGLVSGWDTSTYKTCCQKHKTEHSISTHKNAN